MKFTATLWMINGNKYRSMQSSATLGTKMETDTALCSLRRLYGTIKDAYLSNGQFSLKIAQFRRVAKELRTFQLLGHSTGQTNLQ